MKLTFNISHHTLHCSFGPPPFPLSARPIADASSTPPSWFDDELEGCAELACADGRYRVLMIPRHGFKAQEKERRYCGRPLHVLLHVSIIAWKSILMSPPNLGRQCEATSDAQNPSHQFRRHGVLPVQQDGEQWRRTPRDYTSDICISAWIMRATAPAPAPYSTRLLLSR